MSQPQDSRLQQALADIVGKVRRFQGRNLGEQNTKASLIEPLLEALGWDVRDPDEVDREFKAATKDAPVDYGLLVLRTPRLLVEAKGLGEDLSDRRWVGQIIGYASVAGAAWCVLTDGDEYRLYNTTVAVDAEEKEFCRIRLSDGDEAQALRMLGLISRKNMEGNRLDELWKAHFIDRRIKKALVEMFATPDRGLVRLIRQRLPGLSAKEVSDSVRRADVRVEYPSQVQAAEAGERTDVDRESRPPEEGPDRLPRVAGRRHRRRAAVAAAAPLPQVQGDHAGSDPPGRRRRGVRQDAVRLLLDGGGVCPFHHHGPAYEHQRLGLLAVPGRRRQETHSRRGPQSLSRSPLGAGLRPRAAEGLGMVRDPVLQQFDDLSVWKRGDERAPHKPLLVLYAAAGRERSAYAPSGPAPGGGARSRAGRPSEGDRLRRGSSFLRVRRRAAACPAPAVQWCKSQRMRARVSTSVITVVTSVEIAQQ
jgi:predicted type IV restriction endonuclease